MQAQAGILLIIIIAIGALFLFFGQGLFNPSQIGGLTYSNDLISVEDVFVSNFYPRPAENISIKITLRNNGPKVIRPMVLLLDYQDLKLLSLDYSKGGLIKPCNIFRKEGYGRCEIDSEGLRSFELSEIYAELGVPKKENLTLE